jgi:ketosteroid isomerase-like protein
MRKHLVPVVMCIFVFSVLGFAQAKKSSKKSTSSSSIPDKAYLQKIWDGWSTLDPANVAQFYAKGDHTFFDIAPLKYNNWDEYEAGVKKELADYKSAKFTVNDDARLYRAGEYVLSNSTVKADMTTKADKRDLSNFRWTVVFEKQQGNWLIVHEHVSIPMQ